VRQSSAGALIALYFKQASRQRCVTSPAQMLTGVITDAVNQQNLTLALIYRSEEHSNDDTAGCFLLCQTA